MSKTWITVYECPCGELIENGVGNFDRKFFLRSLCPECGRKNDEFENKGVAYWRWTPIILNWFKGAYIFRD